MAIIVPLTKEKFLGILNQKRQDFRTSDAGNDIVTRTPQAEYRRNELQQKSLGGIQSYPQLRHKLPHPRNERDSILLE
jgi:hypothetical protein